MSIIQEEILEDFLKELRKKDVEDALVNALRALFDAGGKLKADALVAAYEAAKKDDAT